MLSTLSWISIVGLAPVYESPTCRDVKHAFKEDDCCTDLSKHASSLPSSYSYDFIVIGSGIGGAVAAFTFAEAGARTLTLEAGPNVNGGIRVCGDYDHAGKVATQSNTVRTVKTKDTEIRFPDGVVRPVQRGSGYDAVSSRVLGGGGFTNAGFWHHHPPEWVDRLLQRWSASNITTEEWAEAETWTTRYMTSYDDDVFYGSSLREETMIIADTPDRTVVEDKYNATTQTLAYRSGPAKMELRDRRAGFMDRTVHVDERPMTKYMATTSYFQYKETSSGVQDITKRGVESSFTKLFRKHTSNRWDVRTNAEVDKILVKDGRATGVQLKDGSHIFAKRVVLSAGAYDDMVILARSNLGNRDWYESPPTHADADLQRRLDTLGTKLWHPPDWGMLQIPLKDWSTTPPYYKVMSYDGKYVNGQCFATNKLYSQQLGEQLRSRIVNIYSGFTRPDEPIDASQIYLRMRNPYIEDLVTAEEVRGGHGISCMPQVRVFDHEHDYPPGFAHMNKSLPFEFEHMNINFNWKNIGTTGSMNKMLDEFYDNVQAMLEHVDESTAFTSIREAYDEVWKNPLGPEIGIVMKSRIMNAILMRRDSDGKYFVVTFPLYDDRDKLISVRYGQDSSSWVDPDAPDRELPKLSGRKETLDYFRARALPTSGWHLSGTTADAITPSFEILPDLVVADASIIPQTFVQNSMATIAAAARVVALRQLESFEIVDEQPEYIGYRQIKCGITYTTSGEIPVMCDIVVPREYDSTKGILVVVGMTGSRIGWSESPGCYEDPNCYASAGGPDTSIERLARMGMAAVRIHPRSLNDGIAPIQDGVRGSALDVKKGIRFLRKHAHKYGFHPDKVYGIGLSAGAGDVFEILCSEAAQRETEQPNGAIDLRNHPFYDDGTPISSHLNGIIATSPVYIANGFDMIQCTTAPRQPLDFVIIVGGFLDVLAPPISTIQLTTSIATVSPGTPLLSMLTHADHLGPWELSSEVMYDVLVNSALGKYEYGEQMVYTAEGWDLIEQVHMETSAALGLTPESYEKVLDFQPTLDADYYKGRGRVIEFGGVRSLTNAAGFAQLPTFGLDYDMIGKNYSYTQVIAPPFGSQVPRSKSTFPVIFVYKYDDIRGGYKDHLRDAMLYMTKQELLTGGYARRL